MQLYIAQLTKTDTKQVKTGGGAVVADYAWVPLKIVHFVTANAAKNGRFRPRLHSENECDVTSPN
jgi:hypothetical protein